MLFNEYMKTRFRFIVVALLIFVLCFSATDASASLSTTSLSPSSLSRSLETPEELQRKEGTRFPDNYLDLLHLGGIRALAEMLGTPSNSESTQGTPGYLKQSGFFAQEIIDHFTQQLPFIAFRFPQSVLNTISLPSPSPTSDSPFISTAKTKDGIDSWEELLYDITDGGTPAQTANIILALQQRTQEHIAAIDRELRDGGGRFSLQGTGLVKGIDGGYIPRQLLAAGDIKANAESAADALYTISTIQDPAALAKTDPSVPLPDPFFGPSPKPVKSLVVGGGSGAAEDVARSLGVLSPADPFSPLLNLRPDSFVPPIMDRLRDIFNDLGNVPDLPNRFSNNSIGNLFDLFGASRFRDLLGRGGGTTPASPITAAREDPTCPVVSARRASETVIDTARALQLPVSNSWTLGLSGATALFGVRGTNPETNARVTISGNIFRAETCVWVVVTGTDAVFVSDVDRVAFRLTNIEL